MNIEQEHSFPDLERRLGYNFRDPRLLMNTTTSLLRQRESVRPPGQQAPRFSEMRVRLCISDLLMSVPDYTEGSSQSPGDHRQNNPGRLGRKLV